MSKLREISKLSEYERREHLKPEDGCIERGGNKRHIRWCLIALINVNTHPDYKLRKTCRNPKCSNPYHLYFKHKDDENIKHIPKVPPQKVQFNKVCVKTQSREERLSHIDLNQPCIERGGESIQYRGLLAQYLNTEIVNQREPLTAHACFNPKCSNPKHLYYASHYDNAVIDKIAAGVQIAGVKAKLRVRYAIKEAKHKTYYLFLRNFPEIGKNKELSMKTKCPIEAKEIFDLILKDLNNYQSIVVDYHKRKKQ